MTKNAFFFLFLITAFTARGQQVFRVLLTSTGEKTNNIQLASSYVLVKQIPDDSAWYVKQFDMKDTIMSSGYYKDEQLSIPHGKFVYYHKVGLGNRVALFGKMIADSVNRIASVGYYINGVKSGEWFDFYTNGTKSTLNTYADGVLEGLFQKYDEFNGKVKVEGYYKKNKKEGDWCFLGSDSTAIYTNIFKHDKLVKTISYTNPLVDAEYAKNNRSAIPNFDYSVFIARKLANYRGSITHGQCIVSFVVTSEGKVINAKVTKPFEPNLDELLVEAFSNSRWKPALKNGKPVNQTQYETINIVNSTVQFNNGYSLHKSYNLLTGEYR